MAEKRTLSEKYIPNMLYDIYFNIMVKTHKSTPAVNSRLNLPPGKDVTAKKHLPGKQP